MSAKILKRLAEHIEFHAAIDSHKSDVAFLTELKLHIEMLVGEKTQLREDLARCRHQASYSIGDSDALKIQLEKVRGIANESLNFK